MQSAGTITFAFILFELFPSGATITIDVNTLLYSLLLILFTVQSDTYSIDRAGTASNIPLYSSATLTRDLTHFCTVCCELNVQSDIYPLYISEQ